MNSKAFIQALIVATVLQLAMILTGHWVAFVKDNLFAALGTGLSIAGALMYVLTARPGWLKGGIGGGIIGGVSALIGIIVSVMLGDTAESILLIGTVSGLVGGGVAGAVTGLFAKQPAA